MQYTSINEFNGNTQSLMARPPKAEQYLRQASYIQAAELSILESIESNLLIGI